MRPTQIFSLATEASGAMDMVASVTDSHSTVIDSRSMVMVYMDTHSTVVMVYMDSHSTVDMAGMDTINNIYN